MTPNRMFSSFVRPSILALALVLASSGMTAQTTWTGAVSSSWNVAGNWSGGVPTGAVDAIIASGTPNSPSTSGVASAACRSLTVNAGATLTISPTFPLAAAANVTVNGAIAGGGLLRFTGGLTSFFDGAGTIGANVEIVKTGAAPVIHQSNASINGNLLQTSGGLQISSSGGFTLAVSGNALFQGGSLVAVNAGFVDVAGSVTFAGTAVTGDVATLRCGGAWVSDAAFAPAAGAVVFDGTGAQSVTSAGTFPGITVEASSIVATSTPLTLNGHLVVNGTFTNTAASLVVNGNTTVNGTMTKVPGAADLNGSLTVGATGSLALGAGTHAIAGNLTAAGTITGTGTLVFDGGQSATLVSSVPLPNVQVSKTGTAPVIHQSNVSINGNLLQTSGELQISSSGQFTIAVSGNALFQGGSLVAVNAGFVDVAGSVTFAGTAASGAVGTLRCGGAWVSDAAFAPTSGAVVFDGTGTQSVTSTGTFPGITIEASSSVATGTPLTLNGDLVVNGAFTNTAATLVVNGNTTVNGTMTKVPGAADLNGSLTVGATGSLALGAGTHAIAGNLTAAGTITATGTLVFDGGQSATLVSSVPLPNVQVSKTGTAPVIHQSNVSINGNLLQTSGELQISSSGQFTIAVSGNALFQGGSLVAVNAGFVDVAGSVTFAGTAASGAVGTLRCGGAWVSDAAFAPTAGAVELVGMASTTIAHAVAGATLVFPTFVIKNGPRTMVNDFTIASTTFTIDSSGSLAVGGGRRLRVHNPAGPTTLTVNGALGIAANGELSMGPQTAATIGSSGSLSLIGTAAQPAKITGEAGGGYGLTVNGTLAAKDFVVKEMGIAGMVVGFPATIAVAPNDVRNGSFDFRAGAPAGSVLLDVRRQAPAGSFDALAFLNTPGAGGVFNVRTDASSLPISFTNWTGAFAGPTFENDPNNLIAWNLQAPPALTFFVVVPGAELAEIVWHTASQANVTGWQIRKATNAAGPFGLLLSPGLAGPNYGFIDAPLAASQAVFYALYAVMSRGDVLHVGSGSTTPYSAAPPGNVKKVGGNGAFATIQDAIAAATDPNSVVWVTPGTYSSFTIGTTAVPSNLRILGDGTGPVNISTANGPIVIQNVPGSSAVELSNLTVGGPSAPQGGIVISNCASPVVLDQVDVACDGAHTAVSVAASPATAIQRSNILGGTGLSVTNASYVAISRGSLSSLVSTSSTVEIATLTPGSVNVTPPSSLITRTGLMPEINLPEFISLSLPSALFLDAQPNAPFVIGASPRLGFQSPGPGTTFEMPYLLDPAGVVQLQTMFTDGLGQAVVGFEVSPDPTLLGFSFTVQVVVGDPVTGAPRLSNVESMVCIP